MQNSVCPLIYRPTDDLSLLGLGVLDGALGEARPGGGGEWDHKALTENDVMVGADSMTSRVLIYVGNGSGGTDG